MLLERASPAILIDSVASIREIAPSEWSRISRTASFYQGHAYLEAVELDRSLTPRYFLARGSSGELLGALPAYFWRGDVIFGLYDYFASFVQRTNKAADRACWYPALLLGSRAGYLNDLLVDEGLSHAQRVEVLRALLAAATEYARARDVRSMAFLYLRRPALATVLEAVGDSALVLLTAAHARLDLPSETSGFDSYLQRLRPSDRRTAKRDLRRFEASGFEVSVERLGGWYRRCGPLLANLQNRYGQDDGPAEMTEFLRRRAAVADPHTRTFVCTSGDDLVGFALYYASSSGLYSGGCGFDYGLRGDSGAYFSLTYYRPIEHALEARLPAIHLGVGSYEAKLIRGASLESLWSVLFGTDAVHEARPFAAEWNAAWPELMEARFDRFREAFSEETWVAPAPSWA